MKIAKFKIINLSLMILFVFGFFGIHQTSASLVPKSPANLGLVGYWNFEEGRGNKAMDHSGNANTGTLTNFALSGATSNYVAGKTGTALDFDGSNDFITVGSSSLLNINNNLTISVWFKVPVNLTTDGVSLVAWGEDAIGKRRSLLLWNGGSGGNKVLFSGYGASANLIGTSLVADNNWHHAVVTLNSSNLATVYVDGVQQNSGSVTLNSYSFSGTYIGSSQLVGDASGEYFKGQMDEVRIYNRALTSTEVTALYNTSKNTKIDKQPATVTSGLTGYWRLDEGAGISAADRSGNNNTGTWSGAGTHWTTSGKYGAAGSFNGTDDFVDMGNVSAYNFERTDSFSGSAWIKITNTSPVASTIMSKGDDSAPYYPGWVFQAFRRATLNSTALTLFLLSTGGTLIEVNSGANTISANTWYHVAFTYDGSSLATGVKLYINGILQTNTVVSNNLSGTIKTSIPFRVGNRGDAGAFQPFPGSIDDVRIYNRAITADEIRQIYNGGAVKLNSPQNSKLTSGLVGLWSFDGTDLSTTTATDRSGSGNNGTLTGASGAQNKPQPTIGKIGQALRFDGTDDYVNIGSNFGLGNTNLTLSTWAYIPSISDHGSFIKIGGISDGFSIGVGSGHTETNGNYLIMLYERIRWIDTFRLIGTGWHHFAMVVDSSGVPSAYLDGSLVGTYPGGTGVAPTSGTAIGGYTASDATQRYFNGSLDDVRVYNRALSAAEVLQLYNMGK